MHFCHDFPLMYSIDMINYIDTAAPSSNKYELQEEKRERFQREVEILGIIRTLRPVF